MNIFVDNVPAQATERQVARFFTAPLERCGVDKFFASKSRNKPRATITVVDEAGGQRFLALHGAASNHGNGFSGQPLRWDGRIIRCGRDKYIPRPNGLDLRSIEYEAIQRRAKADKIRILQLRQDQRTRRRFNITRIHCGLWDYHDTQPIYVSHYARTTVATVTFGRREIIVVMDRASAHVTRMSIAYSECDSVIISNAREPSVTLTLQSSPKFYDYATLDALDSAFESLSLGANQPRTIVLKKRITSIDSEHARISDVCFVYRVVLPNVDHIEHIKYLLGTTRKAPSLLSVQTQVHYPEEALRVDKRRLAFALQDATAFGRQPYAIRFQVERLVRNGILPPHKVLSLLPKLAEMLKAHDLTAVLTAIRRFARELPAPSPYVDSDTFALDSMSQALEQFAAGYDETRVDDPYAVSHRHSHLALVHKAVVTPAGIYLEGPEPEPTNRVLRQYTSQSANFMRVVFQDEDGAAVRYDPDASQAAIYQERFKAVLDGTITIAGQGFRFLGFSHSSLRAQSCWFMAPWVANDGLVHAPIIIKALGDFTHIRIPAKCAARIGQCFTDTVTSVRILPSELGTLPVVTRNGRDFSDGVGTISQDLLSSIWRVYGRKRLLKPTILQVRFQGAKGVVSLDTRLQGKQLLLRSNMKKFQGSTSWDLEICGAAVRPLPMFLNRPLIKILEDLGTSVDAFLALQTEAVEKLKTITNSASGTAALLTEVVTTRATKLPALIKHLEEIGLMYRQDPFLQRSVEMIVIHELRDIKYRGRIPIKQGVNVYGIMDETGFLREGEVYLATEGGAQLGRDDRPRERVLVTRSPAMHPGDAQIVRAVSVPKDSPLKELSNVIVFSQHGSRDLPSMLSGGDLDGDQYHVVWEPTLIPTAATRPADYPKMDAVKLNREVNIQDMSDFFVKFMENDRLGMISTMHLRAADQLGSGTFDPICLRLATMASVAVDYSKTGIPANYSQMPPVDRARPDFMAPSPRLIVSQDQHMTFEEDDPDEDDEVLEDIDSDGRLIRYYRSEKALGQLYRAIDEQQFLDSMREHEASSITNRSGLAATVLKYAEAFAMQYGILYSHHLETAQEIRAGYDESLLEIAYYYSPTTRAPLAEHEVFSGYILGRSGGAQGKPLRELSKTMRERFDSVVEYAVAGMLKGDGSNNFTGADDTDDIYDDREFEALPRAIASLSVAVEEEARVDPQMGPVESFKHIAMCVCLQEMKRYRITTFGLQGLPTVAEMGVSVPKV